MVGLYVPGRSALHRLGVGRKYLLCLLLTAPPLVLQQPLISVVALALAAAFIQSTGLAARLTVLVPGALLGLLAVVSAAQIWLGQPWVAVIVTANLLTALYSARALTLTTPGTVLVDALVTGIRPLGRIGIDPERFGLAVAVMLRSIPFLTSAFADVRDAARARGLQRNPLANITPVVVRAVGYAQATGEALAARGLGEANSRTGLAAGRSTMNQ